MPAVLCVVSIYNYHREVLPVVEHLARSGWSVDVLLGWRGDHAEAAEAAYAALGCRLHRISDGFGYMAGTPAGTAPRHGDMPAAKPPPAWQRLKGVLGTLRDMVRLKAETGALLDKVRPDVALFGPFHSCGSFDSALLAGARARGLATACYPVSAYHGRKAAIKARFANLTAGMLAPSLRSDYDGLNAILARLVPGWTRSNGDQTIFMWDPLRMAAVWLAGLLERDVWQKPSARFDRVFVYSAFSAQLLRDSGYPMAGVRVVGVPLLDAASHQATDAAARARIFAALGLAPEQPFLLFNVEPSAEHHYLDWPGHWRNFESMMTVAAGTGLPVVLSLHPLCRIEDYLFAEEKFGVHIARGHKIHDLYPLCRMVLSFPCSTNVFAEIFGKPLVVYDFIGLAHPESERVDEFRLPGALVGHDAAEIAALLAEAAALPPAPADAAHLPLACAAIDGHLAELIPSRTGKGAPS